MLDLTGSSEKNSNLLHVEVKNYVECGYCDDSGSSVILKIPWSIWSQWLYICQQIGSREWGCVFWVKKNAVANFKIPKQEVTSSECEFKEELGGDGIVHSHHDMGAFHSSQDNHHARNLYEYSIVLSNSKGYEATRRVKLPCGGFGYVKVELHLTSCPEIEISKIGNKKEFIDEIYRENRQQQLDFSRAETACDKCAVRECEKCQFLNLPYLPCDRCESARCKACRFSIDADMGEMLPFCNFCDEIEICSSCTKLARYLENYPEDRQHFEYLYAHML